MREKAYIIRHIDRSGQEPPLYVIFDESDTWSCCISPEYATSFPTMKAAEEMKKKIRKPTPARLTVMTLKTAKTQFEGYIGSRWHTRHLINEEINVEYDPHVHTKEDVARYWKMFSPLNKSRIQNLGMIHEKVLQTWPTVAEYYPHFLDSHTIEFQEGLTYESFVDSIQTVMNVEGTDQNGHGHYFDIHTERSLRYLYVDGEMYWMRDKRYDTGHGRSFCCTSREVYNYGMRHLRRKVIHRIDSSTRQYPQQPFI